MSNDKRRFVKNVEKFKKTAEKEILRLSELDKKNGSLGKIVEELPALAHFADRLAQKRVQLIDDISWANQFLDQIASTLSENAAKPKPVKAEKRDKKQKQKAAPPL